MWRDANIIIKKLDKHLDFSEIWAIGSFVSKKKRPADIDFTIVTKLKHKSSAWPIDIVIVPKNSNTKLCLEDIQKWMKQRYGHKCDLIRLK